MIVAGQAELVRQDPLDHQLLSGIWQLAASTEAVCAGLSVQEQDQW